MNQISLKITELTSDKFVLVDGVKISESILISLIIDGRCHRSLKYMDVSLVVFSELVRSLSGDGRYLIFTSACGVADEGGWEGVKVKFIEDRVDWNFHVEDAEYHFEFDLVKYEKEIRKYQKILATSKQKLELEPSQVFFPESWD